MAVVAPVITGAGQEAQYDGVLKVVWGPIASGDTCTPVDQWASFSDRSVQATGTFSGSASVAVQGSNDGTNFASLRDPQGTTIALTAAGLKQILENVASIKPVVSAGDGTTAVTVTMLFRRR